MVQFYFMSAQAYMVRFLEENKHRLSTLMINLSSAIGYFKCHLNSF